MKLSAKVRVPTDVPVCVRCQPEAKACICVEAGPRSQEDRQLHPLSTEGQRNAPGVVPEEKHTRQAYESKEEGEGNRDCP